MQALFFGLFDYVSTGSVRAFVSAHLILLQAEAVPLVLCVKLCIVDAVAHCAASH